MFFPYYFDRTILLVLVGMAIVGWAQWRVSHVYKKNQALYPQKGETGAQIARRLLDNAGLRDVPIEVIGGRTVSYTHLIWACWILTSRLCAWSTRGLSWDRMARR